MTDPAPTPVLLLEGRFDRFRRISWWDQARLDQARVLLLGVGALGNEVLKNLALLGVGHVAVVDMDRIESSNLSRSVLFRPGDEGRPKAEVAAAAALAIYPQMRVVAMVGNLLADVGLGWFRWADVVVGALDNREARVFTNRVCAQVGRAWIDGGIDVLSGVVRGFAPPRTACYECTMGQADWDQLNQRRSCSLLARQALAEGHAPTTPTTASVIGAIQAQEVVKRVHGLDVLEGRGFVFEGLGHSSYTVSYPINPDCPWHTDLPPIEPAPHLGSGTRLAEVWDYGQKRLGRLDALDLSRELVCRLVCPSCGHRRDVFQPMDRLTQEEAVCRACGSECVPEFLHSLGRGAEELDKTVAELGLPGWDVVWARRGDQVLGIELAADRPAW